jgi:hypothetical protein
MLDLVEIVELTWIAIQRGFQIFVSIAVLWDAEDL